MPKINLLPKQISELIAAGEVVERPASVVKELAENSIDALSKHITVEIQHGGITYIRITDDGCGISYSDVPCAFLRHATSKISTADDLDSISTLGFRGEALAASSSVSKIELFTKTSGEQFGTHYIIEGGNEVVYEENGCPDGTTIIVRDLFYNTPARMKFLKKDVSEGNAVSAVIERMALSHPEISFKLIRDGKQTLSTSGDGKLDSAIYSVLGREFSSSLIPLNGESDRIKVTGYVCKPVFCRQSRAGQFIFLNGRLVNSKTVMAAVEQAYKNSAMIGKFPAFLINVEMPFDTVDVNVHPAKTEVRFSDEKRIFEAVHYAVKNALSVGDTRPVIDVSANLKKTFFEHMDVKQYRQQAVSTDALDTKTVAEKVYENVIENPLTVLRQDTTPLFTKKVDVNISVCDDIPEPKQVVENEYKPTEEVKFIGEAFSTYIVAEKGNSIFLIDKHAAHERMLFNKLKSEEKAQTQVLLTPVTVRMSANEYDAVIKNGQLLEKAGFEVDDFGNGTVVVRAVPSVLGDADIELCLTEVASSLLEKGSVEIEMLERLYHTVACKAAIKAGYITSKTELLELAKKVLSNDDIMYCPHGRPVAFEIKKYDLEKQFGRIQ
ncbi:MAG: DNA mismatch repair endonuclease MutL [Clostridia bacterium]|nr:DNA mismatch repair endonuclease MutL [Clostridia bacterium]